MSHAQYLPLWAAIIVALLLLPGSGLALVGSYGFWKLRSFYDRVHAPTLGTSWGTGAIVMASMIFFSVLQLRPVLHEFLVGVFVTVTMPITLMLLARAAIYRDRAENNPEVPPMDPPRIKLDVGADPDAPESRS